MTSGSLDEVDRRDGHGAARPRIAGAPRRAEARQRDGIGQPRVDAEAVVKLGLPLILQRCRRDDEHARVPRSLEDLCDDERRLNRFAESDFVCDQDSRRDPVRDRQRRLELKRQQRDAGAQCRAQRGPRRSSLGDDRAREMPPLAMATRGGASGRRRVVSTISNGRRNDARASRLDRSCPRTSRTRRADARRLTDDDPALVADANGLARGE